MAGPAQYSIESPSARLKRHYSQWCEFDWPTETTSPLKMEAAVTKAIGLALSQYEERCNAERWGG